MGEAMRGFSITALWILFILIETSDAIDGAVARAMNQVSDLGKLLDPFADVVARMTYFACLLSASIMPAWTFIIILYREFGMLFVRMMLMKEGIALAAKAGGKIKAVSYAVASGLGLLVFSYGSSRPDAAELRYISWAAQAGFVVSAGLAVFSFVDYFLIYRSVKSGGKHN